MADLNLIESMLRDSGSKLIVSNGRRKWKLPSGRFLVSAKTPSDIRGADNFLSRLRRELMTTHPEIAINYGRALPRNKRIPKNTIGDVVAMKSIPILPPPEIQFEILETDPDPEPIPASQPEPEVLIHHAPRVHHDPKPRPSAPKTLSPEQLDEANRILREQGDAAMTEFLNQCRSEMVPVPKHPTPIALPAPPAPPIPITYKEDHQMSEFLQRARVELDATIKRLENYGAELASLKTREEEDTIRRMELESYIAEHEKLAVRAAQIAVMLPAPAPELPVELARKSSTKPVKKAVKVIEPKKAKPSTGNITIATLIEQVFPAVLKRRKTFTIDQIIDQIIDMKLATTPPDRQALNVTLAHHAKSSHATIARVAQGIYAPLEGHYGR